MEIEDEGVFANAGDEVGDVLGEDDIDVVASLKEERKERKMAASSVKCESKAEGWRTEYRSRISSTVLNLLPMYASISSRMYGSCSMYTLKLSLSSSCDWIAGRG